MMKNKQKKANLREKIKKLLGQGKKLAEVALEVKLKLDEVKKLSKETPNG